MANDAANNRVRALAIAGAFVAACASLAWGAGFDLDPFDSAELALAAVTHGLAHPPGQPLHTLLGWLVTRVPWHPLALLAWLSIAPAAALPLVAARDVREVRGLRWMVAVLVFAALPSVRSVACRIEVYALAALFALLAFRVARKQRASSDLLAGLCAGLAACANPVIAAQSLGALVLAMRGGWKSRVMVALRMGLGAVAGLAPYLYVLNVRGREAHTLVWGAPSDAHEWTRLLTAADFARNVSLTPRVLAANLARLALDLVGNGALVVLLVALVMLSRRASRNVRELAALAVACALGVLMLAANVPYRSGNPDYGGYLLVPLALAMATLFTPAREACPAFPFARVLYPLAGALAVGVVLVHPRPRGVTRRLATEALVAAPPHAIVVLASDHLLFPALYLQRVEGLRDDVTILNPGWSSASWAWQWAHAHDPTLRIDLTPGIGGSARLVRAVRSREAGRAVLAESPAMLRAFADGGVCVRGVLWSSSEGCVGVRRWYQRTRALIASTAPRRDEDSWDARLVFFTARTLGDGLRTLGCESMAGLLYAAAWGRVDDATIGTHRCTGIALPALPPVSVLDVRRADVPGGP